MASEEAITSFPDEDQRYAFCYSQFAGDSTPIDEPKETMATRVNTNDRQGYSVTQRERTDQGYIKVPGKVARTGVQQYLAQELQLNDRKPDEVVNVYRPPEEVFAEESLASYENADVTDDHPSEMVSADTYRQHAVGNTVGPGRPESDYVVVDMLIKDASAIDAVENGKAELSAGYENEYHYEPGTAPDGTPYEYVQRNIRINHIALVDKARAGQEAKLFDTKARLTPMSTITLDGKTVTLDDDSKAQLIKSAFDAQSEKMGEMEEKLQKAEDEYNKVKDEYEKMKAEKDSKDEELEEAKKESSDEAIAAKLKEVSEVKDAAVKVAGENFTCDSIAPVTIKREALKVSRPTIDWDGQSEAYVAAAWDLETTKTEDERQKDATQRSHDGLSNDLAHLHTQDGKPAAGHAAYQSFLQGKGGNA